MKDKKEDTIYEVLNEIIKSNKEIFSTITFDNGSEFARANELEDKNTQIYFVHAYSAWERGTNENFNKLLRDLCPKVNHLKIIHLNI